MIMAMLMLTAVAASSPWAYPLLLDGFYTPRLLAFVHLNTLGIIAALLMGASYQLIPVVLQTPLSSVRLGRLSFWLYVGGVAFFLPGVLETWRPGMAFGAALVFSGLLIYLIVIATTLLTAPRMDVVSWHIALSLIGLAGGIAAGLLLALNKGSGFLGSATFRILAAHATAMLAGWVFVMLNGVAYRLVGMFTLSEDRIWHRVAWVELACSVAGAWVLAAGLLVDAPRPLIGIGAFSILVGQTLFAVQLGHLYRVRRRRGFDVHIPFAMTAAVSGVFAALLLTGGLYRDRPLSSNLWVAVGWLAISGVALSAIQGFFYKIATFLVWLHRYAPLAGRTRVPRLEDLYDRRIAKTGFALWAAALAGSLMAILIANHALATAAGVAALAGLGCFLVNAARIAAHLRPATAATLHDAAGNRFLEIGKEGHRYDR
jgi:hypothetical protein